MVVVPDGVDETVVRARLLDGFGIEIGAGLGSLAGKVWRVGLMGYASREENVLACLHALECALPEQGVAVIEGQAENAAQAALQSAPEPHDDGGAS